MYGIINIAIKDFTEANFGIQKWQTIVEKSGFDFDFNSMEAPYNDSVPYAFAQLIAQECGKNIDEVLELLGESVIATTNNKYKSFMEARGANLKDYLLNLPNFHNRIMLIYPELTPPDFRVSSLPDGSVLVHYVSKTSGMKKFVEGYLHGLVKIFKEPARVAFEESKGEKGTHDVFKIIW